jgi:hypothetical protein
VDPPDLPRQVEGEWAGQLTQLPPHLLHQLAPPRPLPAHHSVPVLNYGLKVSRANVDFEITDYGHDLSLIRYFMESVSPIFPVFSL